MWAGFKTNTIISIKQMKQLGFMTGVLFALIACNSNSNSTKTTEENPTTDSHIFVSNE